jgi:hypothetical protein
MLTQLQVTVYILGLAVLLPLLAYGVIARPGVPETSPLAKYYRAERFLDPAGNLVMAVVLVGLAGRLAAHFRYIDPVLWDTLTLPLLLASAAVVLLYLGLWVRAALRVRRDAAGVRPSGSDTRGTT